MKKKIRARILFNEADRGHSSLNKIPLAQIRFVPQEVASDTAVNIYGSNVSVVAWRSDPIAILIREDLIAKGLRNYFELLWKVAKP